MNVEPHPTARRTAIVKCGVYVVVIAACCLVGHCTADRMPSTERIACIVFFVLVVFGIVWCFTFGRMCKCPDCRKVLRWHGTMSGRRTMVFECSFCKKAWDVGYWVGGGLVRREKGTGPILFGTVIAALVLFRLAIRGRYLFARLARNLRPV